MGIYRYTRSWFRRRRENITAVRNPAVIEEEKQREIVPEEVAPKGDPHLTHEEYLQQSKDPTEGD